jgi:TetR/AcrR family transcriptional regulator, transcriptional repressor for nem operon
MRYDAEHKQATRSRILDAASKRFRCEGVSSVGVASLMREVGLTHGGFYGHFPSKEDLVVEATLTALEGTYARLENARDSVPGGLEGIVREYLGASHRDDPATGCAFPLLAPDIARRTAKGRRPFAKALQRFVALIAATLPRDLPESKRTDRATAIFGLMMGVLQMARISIDAKAAADILEGGVQSALALARSPST